MIILISNIFSHHIYKVKNATTNNNNNNNDNINDTLNEIILYHQH